jgi:hypothetical protein
MSGNAVITGNEAKGEGGGVWIHLEATFTMNGGEISGNTAFYGGGVNALGVGNYSFRIVNGIIYGSNEADASLRNTASGGLSTASLRGDVQYGTFSGTTWNSNGNLYNSGNTIRVVNGVLQQ